MTSWWTDSRIKTTVNRDYIIREIGPRRFQDALHHPLAFGDGLTDDTYLDWILEKGRRCFLILNFIGVPEQIFQLIDKSLDDDDLPLSEEALYDLNLFGAKSETLDKKFYRQQFSVLIQELVPGGHQDFGADEVVPVEPRNSRKGSIGGTHQTSDRVYVHEKLYTRKKIATSGDNGVDRVHFVMHLKALQSLKHPHLVSVWATYTQQDFSYMLLYPVTELTLKQFLDEQPKFFKSLEKQQRRETLLRWTHCIVSALAYLHGHDFTHQNIRPSNVTIDSNNSIYLANFAALNALDAPEGKGQAYRTEIYEHAAPENWRRKASVYETAPDKIIHLGGSRTARRIPSTTKSPPTRPSPTFFPTHRARSAATTTTTSSSNSSSNSRPKKTLITTFSPSERFAPSAAPADVFSLSTVILHLTSLLLGYGPKSFATHRSRHNRQAGRGGAPADASFHVNLYEVGTWMELLMKDAKEREKKDQRGKGTGGIFWRSVGGVIHSTEAGLRSQATERHTARELEMRVGKYVKRALGDVNGLGCGCRCEDEDTEQARIRAEKGKGWQMDFDEEPMSGEPKYRLSIPATVGSIPSVGAYSAIDQERRMGMVLPVMEN
ncbi:MAG: hypothetical protein LQ343_002895 [Gyalolechia ehrenbergii]|nr:MAG: hypothetical protein LQ343_002895 [Gyalolechia ehrenbergii]